MFCTSSQKIYIKGGKMLEKISTNTIHNYKLRISLPWETYKIRRRWYMASQVYTSSSFYVCFIWKFLFRIWNYFHVGCLIYFCLSFHSAIYPPPFILYSFPPTFYTLFQLPSPHVCTWRTASVNFHGMANTAPTLVQTNTLTSVISNSLRRLCGKFVDVEEYKCICGT